MKVIIVGAGVVGTALAEQLSQEGHRVAVIDSSAARVRQLNESMEVLAVHGSGTSPRVLDSIGVRGADMCIAVTSNDEVNLVVGMMAARLGVKHRVVRIRNTEYSDDKCPISLEELGIDHVVNADPFIVDSLERMMDLPGSYDFATLAGGQVEMFGFKVDPRAAAVGKSLRELREVGSLNAFLVLYITRGGKVLVPRGDDVIQPDDRVHFLVSPDTIQFLLPMVRPTSESTRHVIIIGASRIGVELAERLESHVPRVVLVESDRARAENAAARLRKAVVLNGDPRSLTVLSEAAIDRCDFFCALSDSDETNMLATLLGSRHGAAHTAALVNHPKYVATLTSLGVDIVVNPRLAIVGEIIRHVRRGQIYSVTRPAEGMGEIIELEALEGCRASRAPLKNTKFPRDALVGAIVRDGEMMIPTGDTQITAGDRVLVYALAEAIPRIEDLFVR